MQCYTNSHFGHLQPLCGFLCRVSLERDGLHNFALSFAQPREHVAQVVGMLCIDPGIA